MRISDWSSDVCSSDLPGFITQSFMGLGTDPLMIILIVSILYLILGCFLDSIGLMLLTLPIILPLARATGIDLIWFCIILVKLLEMGIDRKSVVSGKSVSVSVDLGDRRNHKKKQ